MPARFPPKTRYKRATRRATSVPQDALRVCDKTRYECATRRATSMQHDTIHALNRYALCTKMHYGVRESVHDTGELPDALHDTGELQSTLHDTGELPDALHDTGELPDTLHGTGEVPTSLSNKTFSLPQTHYCEWRLYLLGFPLLLP